jgi:hypothetical protein
MTPVLLKQLESINRMWVKYQPKTEDGKQERLEMINTLGEYIAGIKVQLRAEEYFEYEDLSELEK